MRKQEKRRRAKLNGGIGGNVVNGDLNMAIKTWKSTLKQSGKLDKLKERRHYVKPSLRRKREIEDAVYRKQQGFE